MNEETVITTYFTVSKRHEAYQCLVRVPGSDVQRSGAKAAPCRAERSSAKSLTVHRAFDGCSPDPATALCSRGAPVLSSSQDEASRQKEQALHVSLTRKALYIQICSLSDHAMCRELSSLGPMTKSKSVRRKEGGKKRQEETC